MTVNLKVGELFAGISGFGLGFQQAGASVEWQVEIEPFARAVLATHFPNAERFDDVQTVGRHNLKRVDVICAGVPCQDVSVAGKRAGLAGERTGLFYEFARILRELRPTWFVFENVPGLLSSNGGRDFAEILRVLMVECGYGVSWRVLNSQFFGVAQRRRRVFVVGRFGRPCPAEILFESTRSGRNPSQIEKAKKGTPCGVTHSITSTCAKRHDTDTDTDTDTLIATTLSAGSHGKSNAPGRRREDDVNLVASTLRERGDTGRMHESPNLVATINSGGNAGGFRTEPGEHLAISAAIDSDRMRDIAGLPEGMDSARYRALGNAVTVQVANWIGRRIVEYEMSFYAGRAEAKGMPGSMSCTSQVLEPTAMTPFSCVESDSRAVNRPMSKTPS